MRPLTVFPPRPTDSEETPKAKAKAKAISPATKARRTLIRAGATPEQVDAFELAILMQVQANSGIGGNASEYVITRINELKEPNP